MKKIFAITLLNGALALTGCAGLKKFLNPYGPPKGCGEGGACSTEQILQRESGTMNFEQALQMFGPPTRCSDAGQTKACVWDYGNGGTSFVPIGNAMMAMPQQGSVAELTFIGDKLSIWRLRGPWK
jgi:hypothetical protein